jgi:hypothetical protein
LLKGVFDFMFGDLAVNHRERIPRGRGLNREQCEMREKRKIGAREPNLDLPMTRPIHLSGFRGNS